MKKCRETDDSLFFGVPLVYFLSWESRNYARDLGLDQYNTDLTKDLIGLLDTHISTVAMLPAICRFHRLILQLRFSNSNKETEPVPQSSTVTRPYLYKCFGRGVLLPSTTTCLAMSTVLATNSSHAVYYNVRSTSMLATTVTKKCPPLVLLLS